MGVTLKDWTGEQEATLFQETGQALLGITAEQAHMLRAEEANATALDDLVRATTGLTRMWKLKVRFSNGCVYNICICSSMLVWVPGLCLQLLVRFIIVFLALYVCWCSVAVYHQLPTVCTYRYKTSATWTTTAARRLCRRWTW